MDDLEIVFSKHYKYVKSYALSLCFDETLAEDITRNPMQKLWRIMQ